MAHLLVFFLIAAHATLDPLSGARVSLATTQQLLAAPFLPNVTSEKSQLGVQAAYLSARLRGSQNDVGYSGSFTGSAAGATYSPPMRRDVGYFVSGVYSQNKGRATVDNDLEGGVEHRFTTSGTVATVGGSLRVFGRNDSALILAVFGGPSLLQFDSVLRIDQALYTSSPFIYGATVGIQTRVRIGHFVFNPYALRFEAFTDACTGVAGAGLVSFPDHCPGDDTKVALKSSFNAYGLVFGYRQIEANVYSKLLNDGALKDISVLNLGLSYTF